MINFTCPNCYRRIEASEEFCGMTVSCKQCGILFEVPGQADADGLAPLAQPGLELPLMLTSYISQHLMPNEHLIAITRIHPLVLVAPSLVATLGLLLVLIGIGAKQSAIGLVVFGLSMAVIAGFVVLALLVERLTTEFSCTNRRILIKSGLITTRLREMPLAKVETLQMEQSLFGKIFGYGTLVFKGSGGTRTTCKSIEQPFDFYRRVQEQVAAAQEHK